MPKTSKFPRLRVSVKRGKAGQVWRSWWYDMRGTGKPDIALGNDYTIALQRWAEIHLDAPRIAGTLEEAFRGFETRGIAKRADGRPRAANTVAGYLKCLEELRPVFRHARWEEIELPDLRAYVERRSAKARARQEMQLLSVIWGWARLEGLTKLPFPGANMQKSGWKGAVRTRNVEVTDELFDVIYRHADQVLKDAMDIATATGLRIGDVSSLLLTDVRGGELAAVAGKTGKRGDFDLSASVVLQPIIDRRKAMRRPEHIFLLADEHRRRPVTQRALGERFLKARAAAVLENPDAAGIQLNDMRKRAAQLAENLRAASDLLQHSSLSVTRKHYRQGDKIKPVR